MKTIIYTFLGALALTLMSFNPCVEFNDRLDDCFSVEHFNLIKAHIELNGEEVKISDRLIAEKNASALEIALGHRFLELEHCANGDERIVVINNDKSAKIPPYSVTVEGDKLTASAYYSRFDTRQDIENRANDWCNIVSSLSTHPVK